MIRSNRVTMARAPYALHSNPFIITARLRENERFTRRALLNPSAEDGGGKGERKAESQHARKCKGGTDETDAALLRSIPRLGNQRFEPNLLDAFFYKRYFTVSTGMSAPCSTP